MCDNSTLNVVIRTVDGACDRCAELSDGRLYSRGQYRRDDGTVLCAGCASSLGLIGN